MLAFFAMLVIIVAIKFRNTYFISHTYILTHLAKNSTLLGLLKFFKEFPLLA